jgi:hypothetical protein
VAVVMGTDVNELSRYRLWAPCGGVREEMLEKG